MPFAVGGFGACSGERVDSALELSYLPAHNFQVSERVPDQGSSLNVGEERDGELTSVSAAQLAELDLCPLDQDREEFLAIPVEAVMLFVDLVALASLNDGGGCPIEVARQRAC
jgi:hypothetical protein